MAVKCNENLKNKTSKILGGFLHLIMIQAEGTGLQISDRISFRKRRNFLLVDPPQKDGAGDGGSQVRQGEAEPHQTQIASPGKNPGQRQQHHQLPDQGHIHTQHTLSQGLEHGTTDNAVSSQQEAKADDPQSRHSKQHHLLRGIEEGQQHLGKNLENGKAHHHDGCGVNSTECDGLLDSQPILSPIVVGNDGNHTIVEAKDRHEHKAHELGVDTEDGSGGGA